jgi:glucose/arabinose dehydrogenase
MQLWRQLCALLAAFAISWPTGAAPGDKPASKGSGNYRLVELAAGLDHPWSLAFLPDGAILVTERVGRLRVIRNGQLESKSVPGVPAVLSGGQAGLFDVVLHPDFANNSLVYLTYASGTPAANATRVARARFDGSALLDLKVIFEAAPTKDTLNHFGGRMVFLPDRSLLLTVGDGFEYREKAQSAGSDLGKLVQFAQDGRSLASRAAFVGAPARTYSMGHRNQQGLVVDPDSGRVYQTEHGPQGGDELNLIQRGHNYGWPLITHGMDYSGAFVSPFKSRPGLQQPLLQWTPSIAPSGLALYRGDKFPAWQGDLIVGALASRQLRRIDLDAQGTVIGQEILQTNLDQRIRDVRCGPDGYLYVTTDYAASGEITGRVLKIGPASEQ